MAMAMAMATMMSIKASAYSPGTKTAQCKSQAMWTPKYKLDVPAAQPRMEH